MEFPKDLEEEWKKYQAEKGSGSDGRDDDEDLFKQSRDFKDDGLRDKSFSLDLAALDDINVSESDGEEKIDASAKEKSGDKNKKDKKKQDFKDLLSADQIDEKETAKKS